MIKIRNDVYLSELEKIGFRWSNYNDHYNGFMYKPRKDTDIPLIIVDIKTRIISIHGFCDMHSTIENTLYDLFEANLIERLQQE